MRVYELNASVRESLGKKETKSLRKEDRVPCVLYGGEKVLHFSVTNPDLRNLIHTPHVYIVNLSVNGEMHKAVIQDMQFHPVSDEVMHIDFYEVFDNKPVTIAIPVILNGFAEGVKAGGKLQLMSRRLRIRSMIEHLPNILEVNVENLGLGKVIKVGELSFENLEILDSPNSVVAAVKLTRAARGALAQKG